MQRVLSALLNALCVATALAQTTLPAESGKLPVVSAHFPTPFHAFVWRNWECITAERMAKVLDTSPENVRAIGSSMGLPPIQPDMNLNLQRNYISIIRRNWHLLPYDQQLALLNWDANQLAYTLREDDFLEVKFGPKPKCPRLAYTEPDETTKKRCAEIKSVVEKHFGQELTKPAQPRFDFVRELSSSNSTTNWQSEIDHRKSDEPIRFLYSYFAVYGDPLLHPELDPYPDGLLQQLSQRGVNGVWLHTVLRQISPPIATFPEFGEGCEIRLANLRKLVDRAARYGIGIYLYMNEPRAMPPDFFKNRPDFAGIPELDHVALCTSRPQVRQWLTDSLEHVFREVPKLAGVFIISASENLTNCASHLNAEKCPRCSKRTKAEIFAEVVRAIDDGVHRGQPKAHVIAWDWGWPDDVAPDVIKALPDDVYLMSVSEWGLPIVRGGVASTVGEYSMSAVGPGPRAQKHWALAKQHGLKTIAKVQVNNTWELSAVPYLPVMNLIAQHCQNLTAAGTDGLMLSWTLGGYPSPNLDLVKQFFGAEQRAVGFSPRGPSITEALQNVAVSRYGQSAAPKVLEAWTTFSNAFTEFPYHPGLLYQAPLQVGPANPLYLKPSGYAATMVGIPYDHVDGWRAVYPADVMASQLLKVASGWQKGLAVWQEAVQAADDGPHRTHLEEDSRLAEAAYLHFKSVANQVRFTTARDALLSPSRPLATSPALDEIRGIVDDEIRLARRLYTLTCQDARIGYEASNHYYYLPLDLVEKVVNCSYIQQQLAN